MAGLETPPVKRRILRRRALASLAMAGLWLCSACGESTQEAPPPPAPPHVVTGCSPLVSGQCLTPFPNSWFEEADASSATGVRVVLPDGTMPTNTRGDPLRQTTLARSTASLPPPRSWCGFRKAWIPRG